MRNSSNEKEIIIATAAMQVMHDKQKNVEKYCQFVEEAAEHGARLLVLPEQSLQGYMWGVSHQIPPEEYEYHQNNAEPIPGETTTKLAELAAQHDMHIVFGMTELSNFGILYNSAVLVSPDGSFGVFRKVHGPGDELHIYRQGDQWPVFETSLGMIGNLICYDAIFPEAPRELTLGGAEIICMPTAWPRFTNYWERYDEAPEEDILSERYFALTRLRAAENQRWFVSSNQVGPDEKSGLDYAGHSRIVNPLGKVLADTGYEEGLAVAPANIRKGIQEARIEWFDILKDRAVHTYRRISDATPYHPPVHLKRSPEKDS